MSDVSAVHTSVNEMTVTDTTADIQPFIWNKKREKTTKTKQTTKKNKVLTNVISQNIVLNINIGPEFNKWCIVVLLVYFFPALMIFIHALTSPQLLNTARQPSYLCHVCKPNMKLALS